MPDKPITDAEGSDEQTTDQADTARAQSSEGSDGMADANDRMDQLLAEARSSEGSDETGLKPDPGSDPRDPRDPSEGSDDSEQGTTSTTRRWWLTNDLLAGGLVASLIAVVLAHALTSLNLQTFPETVTYLYVFAVGSAVAWAFGKDAVEAWRGGK